MKNLAQLEPISENTRSIVLSKRKSHGVTFDLTGYAERLGEEYLQTSSMSDRKKHAQFFTSGQVSRFMADFFEMKDMSLRILDPGAGVGILSAALCERILQSDQIHTVTLDVYEIDPNLIPYLEKVLKKCKSLLNTEGHAFEYNIIVKDFVLDNSQYLRKHSLFDGSNAKIFYDFIISNPPYYKLNKVSTHAKIMQEFLSGQPNIYAFFMALSLEMLKPKGQMVYITPRSFCSGLYFKRFREWLIKKGVIKNIHLFESRKDVFERDEVLQENVIFRIMPLEANASPKKVLISKSQDRSFVDFQKSYVSYEDILHRKNGDIFIKVPTSELEVNVQHALSSWQYTLKDFGCKVSTGPVVSFRATQFLSANFKDKKTTAPLLWMHNIQGMDVIWPATKKDKAEAIKLTAKPLLVPLGNYVLIKRFSSKEQKRRVYAGVLERSKFDFEEIGIENHLNYLYRHKGILSLDETYGIAGILNTSLIDIFFRMVNGNTQVNAGDISNLPFPSLEDIAKIGRSIRKKVPSIGYDLDKAVIDALGMDKDILQQLKEFYAKNGKN